MFQKENFVIQLLNTSMPEASDYLNILNENISTPSLLFFKRSISKTNIIERLVFDNQ